MDTKIIDGKKISAAIKEELKSEIDNLKENGITPGLAVIIVGTDPASKIYVNNKKKTAEELGINSRVYELEAGASEKEILNLINRLNDDKKIHGILVQLPLPENINKEKIILAIDPKKDVDCFHPENIGEVVVGNANMHPCTPAGIMELIKRSGVEIAGKDCVVIGRSNIVGKPLAVMMMQENATVTVCHSKTKDLNFYTKKADIIISAAGKEKLVTADMIKKGVIVIDVGINRTSDGKIAGDVDFESVKEVAGYITPVPGGVGPMTIAMLMRNTVQAAKQLGK